MVAARPKSDAFNRSEQCQYQCQCQWDEPALTLFRLLLRMDPGVPRRFEPFRRHGLLFYTGSVSGTITTMARFTDSVCKRCRREQMKLFLKGSRCFSPKCPIDRQAPPPGMHGTRRSKQSEYGIRLREKQRLKWFYGVLERQFRRYFELASRSPANTGEVLLQILERRLDNVIHRLGFAHSRAAARQLVAHGHVEVNGVKCDIPSRLIRPGDKVKVKVRARSLTLVRLSLQTPNNQVPDFLMITNNEDPEGTMTRLPSRQDVDPRISEIREQLIIEIATR